MNGELNDLSPSGGNGRLIGGWYTAKACRADVVRDCEYKPSDPADSSTSFGWR
jgi:hypothetical protein